MLRKILLGFKHLIWSSEELQRYKVHVLQNTYQALYKTSDLDEVIFRQKAIRSLCCIFHKSKKRHSKHVKEPFG